MFSSVKNFSRFSLNKINFLTISKCFSEVSQSTASNQNIGQAALQQTYGQPTYQTHPHLLRENEIVPGILKDEFKSRRNKLMEKIAKYTHESYSSSVPQIIIIPSATKVYMSDKIPYVFRQNSDFLYFTGCQEPDSVLLLIVKGTNYYSNLFMRYKDAHAELWDGPRTGVEASLSLFGVDQVYPVAEIERYLLSFLSDHKKCNIWYDKEDLVQPEVHDKILRFNNAINKLEFNCPKQFIHQIRAIKSESEISLMQKSCDIASEAIAETIEISKPGVTEHELFATVDYKCRMKGASFLAYPPVVAAGKNSNTIHYISNNQIVKDDEMVLMDAGCEYHGYTSDITRTWPVNGKFTPEQMILYEIVLDVQKILINKLKELPSLDAVYTEMCTLLGKRLQEELLIPKSLSGNKLVAAACTYCPHHVSHYLGMDVHDTPKVSRSIRVKPGMVVTVEPGIYVNPKNQFAPPEFHHLGIRIEDDVLIRENGPVVLTKNCPKDVKDIEEIAQRNQV